MTPFPVCPLVLIRAVFARQVLALANASGNKRLEQAFASVPESGSLAEINGRFLRLGMATSRCRRMIPP